MAICLFTLVQRVALIVVVYHIGSLHGLPHKRRAISLNRVNPSGLCPPGYYGKACAKQCPSPCAQACDDQGFCLNCSAVGVQLPRCTETCKTGSYGLHCKFACSLTCRNRDCDAKSGDCKICSQPGYQLPHCNVSCLPGTYGLDCQNRCPLVCKESCEPVTGDCTKCHDGKGPHCTVNCARSDQLKACGLYCPSECVSWCNTTDGSCSMCSPGYQPPQCQQPCKEGYYGSRCQEKCSERCKKSKCDPFSGICQFCNVGYVGRWCNGQCIPGRYGQDCLLPCPETCAQSLCHFTTGDCIKCIPGYTGRLCEQLCEEGYHGENCSIPCPPACHGKCDPVTGVCWQCSHKNSDVHCNQTCRNGTYGPSCTELCPDHCLDDVCDSMTGQCTACKDNHKGLFCKDVSASVSSEGTDVKQIVYILAGLLAPTVILGLAVVCYKRMITSDVMRIKTSTRKREMIRPISSDHRLVRDVPGRQYLEERLTELRDAHSSGNEERLPAGQTKVFVHADSRVKKDSRRFPRFLHFETPFKYFYKTAAETRDKNEEQRQKAGIEAVLSELRAKQRDTAGKLLHAKPDTAARMSLVSDPSLDLPHDSSTLPNKVSRLSVVSLKEIIPLPSYSEVSMAIEMDCKTAECLSDMQQQEQVAEGENLPPHSEEGYVSSRSSNIIERALVSKAAAGPKLAMSDKLDIPRIRTNVSTVYSNVGPLSHPAMRLRGPSDMILTQSIKCQYSHSDKLSSVDTLHSIASTEFGQKSSTEQHEYLQRKQREISSDQRDLPSITTASSLGFGTEVSSSERPAVSQGDLRLQSSTAHAGSTAFFTLAGVCGQNVQAAVTGERSIRHSDLIPPETSVWTGSSETSQHEFSDNLKFEDAVSEMRNLCEKCQTCSSKPLGPQRLCLDEGTTYLNGQPVRTENSVERTVHVYDLPPHHLVIYPNGKTERFSRSNPIVHPQSLIPDLQHALSDARAPVIGSLADGVQPHSTTSPFSDEVPRLGLSFPLDLTNVARKAPKKYVSSDNLQVKPPLAHMSLTHTSGHRQRKVYSDTSPPKSVESGTGQDSADCVTEDDFSEGLDVFPQDEESGAAQVGSLANLMLNEEPVEQPRYSVSGTMSTSSWIHKTDSLSPMLMRCSTTRQVSPMYTQRATPPAPIRLQPLPTPPPEGKNALRPVRKRSVSSMHSDESLRLHKKTNVERLQDL